MINYRDRNELIMSDLDVRKALEDRSGTRQHCVPLKTVTQNSQSHQIHIKKTCRKQGKFHHYRVTHLHSLKMSPLLDSRRWSSGYKMARCEVERLPQRWKLKANEPPPEALPQKGKCNLEAAVTNMQARALPEQAQI